MYAFLSALPAILGVLGFVVFLILRSFGRGDPATLRIIEKLRVEHPDRFRDSNLTSRQVHNLLLEDQKLQKEVGQQDFALLKQALRQQHVQSITVYALCAGLFAVGVILFIYQVNKPPPTAITGIGLQDRSPQAGSLLVDLDNFLVTWHSSGTPTNVKVFAENLDSGMRSRPLEARSSDDEVVLRHDDYAPLLTRRDLHDSNRIRIVIQANDKAFYSKEFRVRVGMTIVAAVLNSHVRIGATIDDVAIDGYQFDARLVVPTKKGLNYLSLGGEITGAKSFPVQSISKYNWGAATLAYLGPGDRRLVRYEIDHN